MISTPATVDVPLRMLEDGSIRVGESRVLLELVIHAYHRGATPESIVESFPSLSLADVYAVLAYYLQHRSEIDAYVQQSDSEGAAMRQLAEARDPSLLTLRERLLVRQQPRTPPGEDDAARS